MKVIMSIEAPGPLWRRLAWFVGLWAASIAVLAVVAFLIRSVIA